MLRVISTTLMLLVALLFAQQSLSVGTGLEELSTTSTSHGSGPMVHLESSPMGRYGTEKYVKLLNSRFQDWPMTPRPSARGVVLSEDLVHSRVPHVQSNILAQRGRKGLLYLGMTPDGKRKVHAMFLDGTTHGTPSVAFVSTPKVWKSLNEKMQLHSFATVEKRDPAWFQHSLEHDFSASELDSHIRFISPKTSQSEFDSLLPRFPHPALKIRPFR